MVKFVFSLLLIGTAAGTGLSLIVGWLNYRLWKVADSRSRKSLGLFLLGAGIQDGILTYVIIDAGTTEPNLTAWLFVFALLIGTVALGWMAGQMAGQLALEEAVRDPNTAWAKNIERRLTLEEKRNTTIEERAKTLKKRVTEEEQRGEETEGHA